MKKHRPIKRLRHWRFWFETIFGERHEIIIETRKGFHAAKRTAFEFISREIGLKNPVRWGVENLDAEN